MSQLRVVWRLARFSFFHFLVSGLLVLANGYLLNLLPGLVVRQILDTLTERAPVGWNLETLFALLLAALLVHPLSSISGNVAEKSLIVVISTLMRHNLLQRILRRAGAQPLPASPGEAISRFRNDVREASELVTWTLDPLGQVLSFAIAVAILIRIDPLLTFIVFLPLLGVLLLAHAARGKIREYRRRNQEAIGDVTGLLGELYGAALAIKVAGAEVRVVDQLKTVNERRRRAAIADRVLNEFVNELSTHGATIAIAFILIGAAGALHEGRFSVGDFALFASYIGWLTQTTSWVSQYLTRFRQTGISIDRLQQLMQGAPAEEITRPAALHLRRGPPPLAQPPQHAADRLERLEVRGLTYQHSESSRGIHDIDLVVSGGTLTVVTGRLGSGKSTLLRVLLGLLPADTGTIRWNGLVLTQPGEFLIPPRAAYTPQVPRLYSESLRDNILMGIEPTDGRLEHALRAAVLEPDLAQLDLGLETQVGPRGVKLSGGQVERAAAARMLVREPQLLVMDDLSSALDVKTERLLWSNVLALDDVTCLAVSHRPEVLRRADQIVVLKDGRVEDIGRLPQLLERCEEMRALWNQESSDDQSGVEREVRA